MNVVFALATAEDSQLVQLRRIVDQASELASGTSPHTVVEQSMYGLKMTNFVPPKTGTPHKGSAGVLAGAEHSTGPALRKDVSRNLVKELPANFTLACNSDLRPGRPSG